MTQDDAGRIYRNTNESALHVDFVPTPYFARNPDLLRTRGSYEALATTTRRQRRLAGAAEPGHQPRLSVRDRSRRTARSRTFTSVCAPLVYRGDRLPAELYGNVFVAEPAANLVSRIILNDDGTTLRASKAYERGEFLASTDERFRPVYLSNAPDGTLYIVDMYRGVIQQRADITEYLRDHIVDAQAGDADRPRPHLSRRARDDEARPATAGVVEGVAGAAGRRRCRTRTAGGATRRSGCWSSAATVGRAGAREGSRPSAKDWRTRAARAVDARRHRRASTPDDGRSRRWTIRRATCASSAIRLSERWLADAGQSGAGRRC